MKKYDLLHLPARLFKYYRYDDKLNAKRLTGEVYLATPFDFNDPCDCQRDVINNARQRESEKGTGWLLKKLIELGYTKAEASVRAKSLLVDDTFKYEVYKRQLERVGILCLTPNHADTLMWGYYANNDGYCIEYDTEKIVQRLVLGFVNKLDYPTTRRLYQADTYENDPLTRNRNITDEQKKSLSKFDSSSILKITNPFLNELTEKPKALNFVKNIYLKRFAGQNIQYYITPDGAPSTLFYDKNDARSTSKYYKKTKTWKHEDEFRIVVSLGGRFIINVGNDCIKNIYLGCNMRTEKVMEIAYMMVKHNIKAGLYKMRRLKNCGLYPVLIDDVLNSKMTYEQIETYLTEKCKLYW